MISSRIIRQLLFVTAYAWGVFSPAARAVIGDKPLPVLIGELQRMSPDEREQSLRGVSKEITDASPEQRELKRKWLKEQWAALSPEQRDLLRNQIREHRHHLREQRQSEENEQDPRRNASYGREGPRPSALSPDQREEFRQWMRERRSGSSDREDRPPR